VKAIKAKFRTVRHSFGIAVAGLILIAAPSAAHDMWIEPTSFVPDTGRIIGVKLRVGQDFLGDPLPRDGTLIEQFVSVDKTGRQPIIGHDGGDPAGLLRVTAPGLLIIGYRSRPTPIELAAQTFNQYLKDEGLDAVASIRASRNQTNNPAHEVFARCAKSLLLSGSPSAAEGDQRLGFTLELVAERNPYTLRAGDDLPVSLTYEGRPLQGALVVAMNRRNAAAKLSARTDRQGHVTFKLPQEGIWLIKAVHMIPAPSGANAEWASFWASLTFELKSTPAQVASK
jgi:uncharacterized GH25 family protein